MINRHELKHTTWVELDHPTPDEAKEVMEEYGIAPSIARELLAPSLKQRVESFGDHVYLILHFPAFKHTHREENVQEVDFILGKDYVITAKYDTIDSLHKFSKVVEVETILKKSDRFDGSASIFFGIIHEIYASLLDEVAFIEDWMDEIERNVFKGEEREMVFALSHAGRNLLDLKKVVEQHKDILENLEAEGAKFGEEFVKGVKEVKLDFFKVRGTIRGDLELLQELRDTNDSMLTTKQNEVMKVFTILAFITFPLSLITSVFSMNTEFPFQNHPYDFWLIIGGMAVFTACMVAYIKYKKWL